MIHSWQRLVDFIFPPSPALQIIRAYQNFPDLSLLTPFRVDDVTVLTHYQTPLIKALVTAGKFEHNTKALAILGQYLRHYLEQNINHYPPAETILVPIPLHTSRERERGYNQVDLLLQAALAGTKYRSVPLLKRTRATSPQSQLGREERLTHLTGAFTYQTRTVDWSNLTKVVLVDDVLTTGSTLAAGRATLAPHLPPHIKLELLAFAH